MLVGDIVEIAKVGALSNLQVARNDKALIKFTYLGVAELYRKFNLSIKVESIQTNPHLGVYEIKDKGISLLLTVYNSQGQELRQSDTYGIDYDYKIVNYKSFLLKNPKHDLVFAVYKSSPNMLSSLNDEIELPDAFIDALLAYISYMGHSTINKDNINEASAYLKRFDDTCLELDKQGYRINISTESLNMLTKGYI